MIRTVTTVPETVPSPAGPCGFVVGCLDSNVYLCVADGAPIATFAGHAKGVVDLSWTGMKELTCRR